MSSILHIVIPQANDTLHSALQYRLDDRENRACGLCSSGADWQPITNTCELSKERIAILKPDKVIVNRLLKGTANSTGSAQPSVYVWWHPPGKRDSSASWKLEDLDSRFNKEYTIPDGFVCFPFSLRSSRSLWDNAITKLLFVGGFLKQPATAGLSELDQAAETARIHFVAFQPVKAILEDLFLAFIVIREIEEVKEDVDKKLLIEGRKQLRGMIDTLDKRITEQQDGSIRWLNALYGDFLHIPLNGDDDFPKKANIENTLKSLKAVSEKACREGDGGFLEKEDFRPISTSNLKQLFQLLNAYPTVTS